MEVHQVACGPKERSVNSLELRLLYMSEVDAD